MINERGCVLIIFISLLLVLLNGCVAAINQTTRSQNYGIVLEVKAEYPDALFVTISQSELRNLRNNDQRIANVSADIILRFCDMIGFLYTSSITSRGNWNTCVSKFSADIKGILYRFPNDNQDITFSYFARTGNVRNWLIANQMGGMMSGVNSNSYNQLYDGILDYLTKIKLNQ
jgi:hypothetical protein